MPHRVSARQKWKEELAERQMKMKNEGISAGLQEFF